MSLPVLKCCNNDSKFIFVYDGNLVIVCEGCSTTQEYRTGLKGIHDYETGQKLEIIS